MLQMTYAHRTRKHYSQEQALRWLTQIAEGLKYLHTSKPKVNALSAPADIHDNAGSWQLQSLRQQRFFLASCQNSMARPAEQNYLRRRDSVISFIIC